MGLYSNLLLSIFPSFEPRKNLICPFHPDHNPSLSIDDDIGLYYCFGCGRKGNIKKFFEEYETLTGEKIDYKEKNYQRIISDAIQIQIKKELDMYHKELMASNILLSNLEEIRGWDKETVETFYLGWNAAEKRLWIPVFSQNEDDSVSTLKKYDVFKVTGGPKFLFLAGTVTDTVFPGMNRVTDHNEVWLMAGEGDTILANQLMFPALCLLTGELSLIPKRMIPGFVGKDLYICYDSDVTGESGRDRIIDQMEDVCSNIYIVTYNNKNFTGKDFTDFYLFNNRNVKREDLKIYPASALKKVYTLHEASSHETSGVSIYTEGIVTGISPTPFRYPKEIKVKCNEVKQSGEDKCEKCLMSFLTDKVKDFSPFSDKFFGITDLEKHRRIKSMLGLKCEKAFEIVKEGTLEQFWITPDLTETGERHLLRRCLLESSDVPLELNHKYLFRGKVTSEPQSQELIFVFKKAELKSMMLDNFQLSNEHFKSLKEILKDKYNSSTNLYLRIIQGLLDVVKHKKRWDIAALIDLTYFSLLSIPYLNRIITKGYLETCIAGDTYTEKTGTAKALQEYYGLGEYISCEKATIAGIIGGQEKIPKVGYILTWGTYPRCDRTYITLDECQGLEVQDIKNLSAIRSSGIAERTVVGGTRRTYARVRTTWIGNPREFSRVEGYKHGTELIEELFGDRMEDVARLDLATIIARESEANLGVNEGLVVPPNLIKEQLLWAWSRKVEDVIIKKDTYDELINIKKRLIDKYGTYFPLIGEYVEIKVLKIAASIAARLFSTETGKEVIVKPEHLEIAFLIMDYVYSKKEFGYDSFIDLYRKSMPSDKDLREIEKLILHLPKPKRFVQSFLWLHDISFQDFGEIIGENSFVKSRELRQNLISKNMVYVYGNKIRARPQFVQVLKGILKKM